MTTPTDTTTGQTHSNPYAEEAAQRWGHTDAYQQSQARVAKMSKDDMACVKQAGEDLMKRIAAAAEAGKDPAGSEVQALIAEHYNNLRAFYEPSLELYRGLADLYVGDERFTAYYDKFRPGLATFMREAMHVYCDAQTATN